MIPAVLCRSVEGLPFLINAVLSASIRTSFGAMKKKWSLREEGW
jgi:hypothetical protein